MNAFHIHILSNIYPCDCTYKLYDCFNFYLGGICLSHVLLFSTKSLTLASFFHVINIVRS